MVHHPAFISGVILILGFLAGPLPCALGQSTGQINRPGVVRVSIDALLNDSTLQETSYRDYLQRLFQRQEDAFATAIAAGLRKTVFTGDLKADLSGQTEGEATRENDSFLVSVDSTAHYGLSDSSAMATFLAGASCFTLGGLDMFKYESQSRSHVTVFYINNKGQRLKLLERRYESHKEIQSDFFDAMSMSQEALWVDELTAEIFRDIKTQILTDLPGQIIERAWSLTGENLRQPQKNPSPLQELGSPLVSARPSEAQKPDAPKNLQELIRTSSRSTFEIITPTGTGSGFVLSSRGYLLTSLHNVSKGGQMKVRFRDGREFVVRLFLKDEDLDLAVLVAPVGALEALPLGDSDRLKVGDTVIALGYPAEKGLSFSRGRVNSKANFRTTPILITDSQTEPGSSGGPLLNDKGEVVGINFRKTQGHNRDTTYSLPINEARKAFEHLLDPT